MSQQPVKFTEKSVDAILNKVKSFAESGGLRIYDGYSPENEVRLAWMMLKDIKDSSKRPALEVCSFDSIANAFLEFVIKGLSISKGHGSFIIRWGSLYFDESYFGTIYIAKRDAGVKDINPCVIYKGDVFKYAIDTETGRKKITVHEQDFANIDVHNIVGAYATVIYNDGSKKVEIMTMTQIRTSWEMGIQKGNGSTHKNFPDQMAMRTVIVRALKQDNNSSSSFTTVQIEQNENADPMQKQVEGLANSKPLPTPNFPLGTNTPLEPILREETEPENAPSLWDEDKLDAENTKIEDLKKAIPANKHLDDVPF